MKKQTRRSLGWTLRDTIAADSRWRLGTLMLSRPRSMKLAGFEPLRRGTYAHTVTFVGRSLHSMVIVDIPTDEQTLTKVAASLRASGYDGSASSAPNRSCGIWTRRLRSVRDAVEELSRTASAAARESLDTTRIRSRDALLEAARAGAFGRLELYTTYVSAARLRAGSATTTLQMMLGADERGVGFTFTGLPVRMGSSDRSAIATELERLDLDVSWSKVPGAGFMLSGGSRIAVGKPQTSIAKAVAAASTVWRWAKERR